MNAQRRWREDLAILFGLSRPRLSLLVALSAVAAGLLAPGSAAVPDLALAGLGALLLAGGGSAANQLQERRIDARMERTRHRPLPAGRVRPAAAALLSMALCGTGLALAWGAAPGAALAGGVAVAWYLGVYTPLKRVTPFALLAGAPCGAAPVVLGWLGNGGSFHDPELVLLTGLLLLWQIPHFLFLALDRSADYRRAGLPILEDRLSRRSVRRLAGLWILALGCGAWLLCLGLTPPASPLRLAAVPLVLWLWAAMPPFLQGKPAPFGRLNLFLLLLLGLLAGEGALA